MASSQWRWSEKEPFPPLPVVLKTPLWSDPKYEAVRQRLLTPIPQPEVRLGGAYVTVDLHPPTKATSPKASEAESSAAVAEDATQGAKKAGKRAAAAVDRYGLIHITGFNHRAPLPSDLSNIQYSALVVEASEQDFTDGVHPQVTRLLSRGVPTLVVGERQDVNEFLTFVRDSIVDSRQYDMELTIPATAHDPKAGYYRYRRYRMVFISRSTIQWKV